MQKRTLVICRGLPGSGKSSLARAIAPTTNFAADNFFEKGGTYAFDPALLGKAHAWCTEQVELAMARQEPLIAVHNTFSQSWEARIYFALANNYDYTVFVVEAQNDFGNVHNVPNSAIQKMRDQWEPLDQPPMSLWRILRNRLRHLIQGSR